MRQITTSFIIGIIAGATLLFDVVPAFTWMPIIVVMMIGGYLAKSRRLMTILLCLAFVLVGIMRAEQEVRSVLTERESRFAVIEDKMVEMRGRIEYKLGELGLDGDELAVTEAMTLGDKNVIDKELRQMYSDTGASHVLALSGMHMAIVYAVLSVMLLRLPFLMMLFSEKSFCYGVRRRWSPCFRGIYKIGLFLEKKNGIVIILSLLLLWLYILLVGMPASAVRAGIMLSACSLSMIRGCRLNLLDSLTLAAFLMLVVSPLELFDVGFQMSFMAVLGIGLYFRDFSDILRRWLGKFAEIMPVSFIISAVALTVSAQIMVLPLVAFYFHSIPCYGILTSLVVSVTAVVIVWLGVFIIILMPLSSSLLFQMLVKGLNVSVMVQNEALKYILMLPGGVVDMRLSLAQLLLVYVIIACGTICFRKTQ